MREVHRRARRRVEGGPWPLVPRRVGWRGDLDCRGGGVEPRLEEVQFGLVACDSLSRRLGSAEGPGASTHRVLPLAAPCRSAGGEAKGGGATDAGPIRLWKAVRRASWKAPGSVNLERVHS